MRAPDLRSLRAPEILALADEALAGPDAELLSDCWNELRRRSRKRSLRALERAARDRGVLPIPWLEQARAVVADFERETRGRHHLYFVLLGGYGREEREYGVYVGETYRRPERRFEQHKAGIHDAGVVRRRGLQLLPSLARSLNPLGRAEARRLERAIAEALRRAGIRVEGGH